MDFVNFIRKYVSRDFLLIVALGLFAFATASGWLTSAKIDEATENITKVSDALPRLIDALTKLLDANGPLIVFALGVWAYIRRKFEQKNKIQDQEMEKLKAEAELNKLQEARKVLELKRAIQLNKRE